MQRKSSDECLIELLDNIRTLHEENAELIKMVDSLTSENRNLTNTNLKLSQEIDSLNLEKNELYRRLNSIHSQVP